MCPNVHQRRCVVLGLSDCLVGSVTHQVSGPEPKPATDAEPAEPEVNTGLLVAIVTVDGQPLIPGVNSMT